jgi:hypothetical protein
MTQVNYATMSDQELKHYIFTHRDDQEAFHAYMSRRRSRPRNIAIEFDDPAWEEKITAFIQAQLDFNRPL